MVKTFLRGWIVGKLSYICGDKTANDMKVKIYLDGDCHANDSCCIEAEFECAPRVGDIVAADWESLKDALIKGGRVGDFCDYMVGDSRKWYSKLEAQKTMAKPTDEQIKKDIILDGVGKITSMMWVINNGVAECVAWVGDI